MGGAGPTGGAGLTGRAGSARAAGARGAGSGHEGPSFPGAVVTGARLVAEMIALVVVDLVVLIKDEEDFGVVFITTDEVVEDMVEIGVEVEATTVEEEVLGLAHLPL